MKTGSSTIQGSILPVKRLWLRTTPATASLSH